MPTCWHCKTETPAAHYARVVENKTALHGEWDGWRMAGRFLIAPGKAGRIMPARLLGMLWAENSRSRCSNGTINDRGLRRRDNSARLLPPMELFRGQA